MKEIGGYFQLDQLIDSPFHENLVELNTGRNALIYLVNAKKIKKLYLPHFLCSSVSNILIKYNIDYEYYHIGRDFLPKFEKKLKNKEYLYVVNYYGQLSNSIVQDIKDRHINIILDNTQSFFQRPISNVDTIYSCRKYFGLPDGAYLATEAKYHDKLQEDKSSSRMTHILGRYEGDASDFYNVFKKNDELFKELPVKKMSKITKNLLGAIDYNKIIERRNENFEYLHKHLKDTNPLNIEITSAPFSYPYYIENGIEVRKLLAKKNIFIPTLWPNVLKENNIDSTEFKYAANILPVPCDQRYDIEDMKILIEELRKCTN